MAWWHTFRRSRGKKPEPPAQWLVAGLGNPGPEYVASRHNFGFIAADVLIRSCGGHWTAVDEKKPLEMCSCRLARGTPLMVVRPLAYMNRSGGPVQRALDSAGLDAQRLIVLVDDLALPLGVLRIRAGGGDGGHKGLWSVAETLGTGDFVRIRLGVAPSGGMPPAGEWVDHVLGSFEPEEEHMVRRVSGMAVEAVAHIVDQGVSSAMNRFNRRQQET